MTRFARKTPILMKIAMNSRACPDFVLVYDTLRAADLSTFLIMVKKCATIVYDENTNAWLGAATS